MLLVFLFNIQVKYLHFILKDDFVTANTTNNFLSLKLTDFLGRINIFELFLHLQPTPRLLTLQAFS